MAEITANIKINFKSDLKNYRDKFMNPISKFYIPPTVISVSIIVQGCN